MKPAWSLTGTIAVAGRPSFRPSSNLSLLPAHRPPGARLLPAQAGVARLLLAHAGVAWARNFSLSLLPCNARGGRVRACFLSHVHPVHYNVVTDVVRGDGEPRLIYLFIYLFVIRGEGVSGTSTRS